MTSDNHGVRKLSVFPPQVIEVDGDLVVRRYVSSDASELREAVIGSLEHLRPWMPWIAHEPLSVEQREELINEWKNEWDAGTNFVMGIFHRNTLVGGTGLHLRGPDGSVEIGYWLVGTSEGQGIVTRVVKALTDVALSLPDVTIVEIVNDEANERSAAVPRRCGYELVERFAREREAPGESGVGLRWRTQ